MTADLCINHVLKRSRLGSDDMHFNIWSQLEVLSGLMMLVVAIAAHFFSATGFKYDDEFELL